MTVPQCQNCPLLICDFISPKCRLSPREIAEKRPDLSEGITRFNLLPTKDARYYWRNREAILARHREANKEAARRYRQNRAKRVEVERRYRDAHRDEINARRREKRKIKRYEQTAT